MNEEREPEIDESLLTPEQKRLLHQKTFNWKWGVFWLTIIALMVVCLVVILVL